MVAVGMVRNLVLELQLVRILDILPQELVGLQIILSHQLALRLHFAKSLAVTPKHLPATGASGVHDVVCSRVSEPSVEIAAVLLLMPHH